MKIQNKLLFTLLGLSVFIIFSLAIFAYWSFGQGLISYVNSKEKEVLQPFVQELEQSFAEHNDWREWQDKDRYFFKRIGFYLTDGLVGPELGSQPQPNSGHPPPNGRRPNNNANAEPPSVVDRFFDERPPPPELSEPSFALLDTQKDVVVGQYLENADYNYLPLTIDGQPIGTLAIAKKEQLSQDYEFEIVQQQQYSLVFVGLFLFAVVVLVSLIFARHFVEPIKNVVTGMTQLTRGNYEQAIDIERKDELATLSQHFNTLASRLAQTESQRKRWLATVSHELRTPVAILKGETEALIDGVRPPTTKNLESILSEIDQLNNMIDDLYVLTSQQVEDIQLKLQRVNLVDFLNHHQLKYKQYLLDNNIEFVCHWPLTTLELSIDRVRINQLFENIFTNCVKYSQATQIVMSVRQLDDKVEIIIEDNGIGIAPHHLAHIFEYLYRVEEHRHRSAGGLGLGLALCAQIVHRHQGDIYARKSELGGLAICIKLPLTP
jgi:two-component system sensor histidine kinase BaeS